MTPGGSLGLMLTTAADAQRLFPAGGAIGRRSLSSLWNKLIIFLPSTSVRAVHCFINGIASAEAFNRWRWSGFPTWRSQPGGLVRLCPTAHRNLRPVQAMNWGSFRRRWATVLKHSMYESPPEIRTIFYIFQRARKFTDRERSFWRV